MLQALEHEARVSGEHPIGLVEHVAAVDLHVVTEHLAHEAAVHALPTTPVEDRARENESLVAAEGVRVAADNRAVVRVQAEVLVVGDLELTFVEVGEQVLVDRCRRRAYRLTSPGSSAPRSASS